MRIVAETTAAVLVTLALASVIERVWLALLLSALTMTAASFVLVGASPRSVGRFHPRTLLRLTAWIVHGLRVYQASVIGPAPDAHALASFMAGLKQAARRRRARQSGIRAR